MSKRNIILIVGILVLTGFLVSIKVNSFSISKEKKELEKEGVIKTERVECGDNTGFAERYGTKATPDGNGNVEIKLYPENSDKADFPGIEFYVEQISTVIVKGNTEGEAKYIPIDSRVLKSGDSLISEKSSYTLTKDIVAGMKKRAICEGDNCETVDNCVVNDNLKENKCMETDTLLIRLRSKKENSDKLCKGVVFYDFEVSLDAFNSVKRVIPDDVDEHLPDVVLPPSTTGDCNKPVNEQTDFEKSYCGTITRKNGRGDNGEVVESVDYSSELAKHDSNKFDDYKVSLKCNPKNIIEASSTVTKNKEDDSYYTEGYAMHATKKETKSFGNYVYNYAPGLNQVTESVNVSADCTEKVKVQYGPPVAATAGMCFEYNVRVISTVVCKANKVDKPKVKGYCTPIPNCYHPRSGNTLRQGGPDEDFDQCIDDCDGGKYTEKCSLQCYNSVYGKDKKKSGLGKQNLKGVADSDEPQIVSLDDCIALEKAEGEKYTIGGYPPGAAGKVAFYGCYYWGVKDGKKQILWKSDQKGSVFMNESGSQTKDKVGFAPARFYKEYTNKQMFTVNDDGFFRLRMSDGLCSAQCSWSGCGENEYLNPAQLKKDYAHNKKTYEDAKRYAESISTCHTTTTEFNIKATEYGKYYTSVDKLVSPVSSTISEETKLQGKKYIFNYSGCYQDVSIKGGERYHTTWGFPGTWVDVNKTQAISFVDKSANDWELYPGKFCLPYTANTVNEPYWSYYYTNYYEGKGTSVDSEEYKNKCLKGEVVTSTNVQCYDWVHSEDIDLSVDSKDIKWNIEAYTKKFGHFEWNIDIDCFYAYSKALTSKPEGGTICEKSEECGTIDKRIRSVDPDNLFPASDGSNSERAPGFNWSEYATNTKKDSNYSSVPSAYKKYVEAQGSKIYSNESELDYRIYLSKKDLQDIKNKVKDKNFSYTNYDSGKVEFNKESSVGVYKSDLLRNELTNSNNKLPGDNVLSCNNIKGNECMKFEEGDK